MFFIHKIKKKLFPKTLLTRFVLIIIIPILAAQLIAIYLFYQKHWYNVIHHTSEIVAAEINSLLESNEYSIVENEKRQYLNLEYRFIRNSFVPTDLQKYNEEINIFRDALKRVTGKNGYVETKKFADVVLHLQLGNDTLIIRLPYKSLLNPSTYIFVLWILFLTISLLTVSLIFSRNQIRSIIELTQAAEDYGTGNKKKLYTPSGAKEIRRAGLAFIKMRDRIERQTAKRTQMLAMISHDLKTPLTRMKLQVELMEESEEKKELEYDIKSMQHMIESYLDFARGEGGEEMQEVDLVDWIKNLIQRKWTKDSIALNLTKDLITTNLKVHSFERAISNLISNALKYSTKIEISVYSENENAIIVIEDNGIGISEKNRELVFKPFFRADKSRSLDNMSSVGLGLAITKEIINGHFGSINLEDSKKLRGLLVRIKLPIKSGI